MHGCWFNRLLEDGGLRPADVSMLLHTTTLQPLRNLLPVIAQEHPDLFRAYQSVHSLPAGKVLKNRPLVASFVPVDDVLVLEGIYKIAGYALKPTAEVYANVAFHILEESFGASDVSPALNMARLKEETQFDLERLGALDEFRGRLQIARPKGMAYVRLAKNLNAEVIGLSRENLFERPAPDWRDFSVTGPQMCHLPCAWAARLREWRGIYLILDGTDGARYVGSAYGQENLLGRWRTHVAADKGVTKKLARRNPAHFRFSILERVSPDMSADEVIALEHGWMQRLHTIEFGLNT